MRAILVMGERRLKLHTLPDGPRRFLAFLFLNVISWQCLIGTILVLHARALGIDRGAVGVLTSLLYFAGGLGILTKPLAERYGSKRVLMTGWTARNLLVLPIVLTPVVLHFGGTFAAATLLFITISLFCVTRALAGIAWSSWLHEIVPPVQLGHFYSLETIMTRLLTVVFGVSAFFLLGKDPPVWRFALIAAAGVAFGLFSLRVLRRVPGGAPTDNRARGVRGSYRLIFQDRMFMSFLACSAVFSMIYIGMNLLLTLTLRDQIGLGAGTILLLMSTGNLLAMGTTTRWRRVADRHGSPVAMAGNGLIVVICLLVLGFMRRDHAPLPLLAGICALIPVAESGNYVAASRGYMLRMRPQLRHACNAVWSAGTQLLSGFSAIFVGAWLKTGGEWHYRSAAWGFAVLMAAAILIALHLPVPDSDTTGSASRIFNPDHPLRSLGGLLRYVLRPASAPAGILGEPLATALADSGAGAGRPVTKDSVGEGAPAAAGEGRHT